MAVTTAKHRILVFDSGVGGLSIVQHIRQVLPQVAISYLADNKQFPYGLLNESQLVNRVKQLICCACEQWQFDLIVIACNSASTLVLPTLRANLTMPIVGVVPAVKPAAASSSRKAIGLLATPGTVDRQYTNDLISNFANDCEVIRVGSSELVEYIELKLRGHAIDRGELSTILRPFRHYCSQGSLDTVVLACTHFPLALDELLESAPEINYWIDSGAAIARQVSRLLLNNPTLQHCADNLAFFTDITTVNEVLKNNLNHYGFEHVQQW